MLRELQVQELKPIRARYKAAVDMVVGMGVVVDTAAGTVKLPTAATAYNIFVVDKEREAKGVNNVKKDFSDRFTDFIHIKAGEFVKLHNYDLGDEFATDQTESIATLAAADYATVGTDGRWAVSQDPTKFHVVGTYSDAGNPMVAIEIVEVEPVAPEAGLPEVTVSDNGDVLTVVEGAWAKAAPSGGGERYLVTETPQPGGSTAVLDKTAGEIYTAFLSKPVFVTAETEATERGQLITWHESKIITNVTRDTRVDENDPDNNYDDFIIYAGGGIQWSAAGADEYPERNLT